MSFVFRGTCCTKGQGSGWLQERFQNTETERQTKRNREEISSKAPGSEIEKCSFHPDNKLSYHCENESCKLNICEVCWTDSHYHTFVKETERCQGCFE